MAREGSHCFLDVACVKVIGAAAGSNDWAFSPLSRKATPCVRSVSPVSDSVSAPEVGKVHDLGCA